MALEKTCYVITYVATADCLASNYVVLSIQRKEMTMAKMKGIRSCFSCANYNKENNSCAHALSEYKKGESFFECCPLPDAKEDIYGRWSDKMFAYRAESDIEENGDMHFGFKCSVCGGIFNKTNFCGGCGADMRSDTNDPE